MKIPHYSRRDFLKTLFVVPATGFLAACARALGLQSPTATSIPATHTSAPTGTGATATLPPTPACGDDDDDPTPQQTEGPFYTPDSAERKSLLEEGMQGVYMMLSGKVLGTDCHPIPGALLDFWHADANGIYDNVGYTLRGHQFADENGRYELETIMPGLYTGRTRHFHVKVQRPKGPILTTQLYFPDEPDNLTDGIFDERLLITMLPAENGVQGEFNFVLT
ncbi:MAG: intradiol ring-cleavage dioxygenase [Anaerolineales bacterium]